ncbi:MAG: TIGR02996 domain-containing protein [Planctomycetes bacterium]|nr:TIGR02996 domain-containing protein [Planctomycetota bacterium]
MPRNDALFAAILAHPCEDTPRLAYADWLDENGDPDRARFIRLQYEIEKLPPIGPTASKAKKAADALLQKHETEWSGELKGLVRSLGFRRGFVERVGVTADQFLAHGGRLFELAPVREVRFDPIRGRVAALAAAPHFGRAEALGFDQHISDQPHDRGHLDALLAAPALATVRRLDFRMSCLGGDDLTRVARCPYLGSVVHLDLSFNPFDAAGLRALAHSDRQPALTSLALWGGSWHGLDGVRELVDSPLADRLEHLVIAWQRFGDGGVKILTGAPRLKRLRTLDLSDNDITDTGAAALAAAPQLAGLERLTLRGHRKTLGKDGRERLRKRFGKDACVF